MLEGSDPVLAVLREQLRQATVTSVELSGVGFFAHLAVPRGLPIATPPRIVGGDAAIVLTGVEHGAGCVLFVDDGRLSMFEGYTYAGEEWAESVATIGPVTSVVPANPALRSDGRVGRSASSRVRR